jgi:RNA polymerase sigma factor (TIGR02999 family)
VLQNAVRRAEVRRNADFARDRPAARNSAILHLDALRPGGRLTPRMNDETRTPSTGHGPSTVSGQARMLPPAADELLVNLYDQLHGLARHWFASQPPDHTLQPTAIVHEAYLRVSSTTTDWRSDTHFYAIAARAMRQVLVDHARRRRAQKRGGTACRVELSPDAASTPGRDIDVLALEDALERLARLNARQARVVELRFFAGLSIADIAAVVGVCPRTVKLDWRMARAWLQADLQESCR